MSIMNIILAPTINIVTTANLFRIAVISIITVTFLSLVSSLSLLLVFAAVINISTTIELLFYIIVVRIIVIHIFTCQMHMCVHTDTYHNHTHTDCGLEKGAPGVPSEVYVCLFGGPGTYNLAQTLLVNRS